MRSDTESSASEEEHWQEAHRQRVRLIRQQESDDRCSRASADKRKATPFPQGPLHGIPCH